MRQSSFTDATVMLIDSRAVESKVFDLNRRINPGVGGTEFLSIQLMFELARLHPHKEFVIITRFPFEVQDLSKNLQVSVQDPFLAKCERCLIIICQKYFAYCRQQTSNDYIGWLHHPFLPRHKFEDNCKQLVTIGVFQDKCIRSTRFNARVNYINNLYFPNWQIFNAAKLKKKKSEKKVVFMGALVKAKGFLHVAKNLKTIIQSGFILEVIGAASTYGKDNENKIIPTTNDFAAELMAYIPKNEIGRNLIFHGNLGQEKSDILLNSSIGFFNPTGKSEAFPATLLEMLNHGVRVFTLAKGGNSDVMKYFPENTVDLRKEKGVSYALKSSQKNIDIFYQKAEKVLLHYEEESKISLMKWSQLINRKFETHTPYGYDTTSRISIYFHYLISNVKSIFKKV